MEIKPLEPYHWDDVKRIYEEGISTGNATFETSAPSWENWDTAHLKNCRFVAIEDGVITGWAALTPASGRCVYAGVADISVYVSEKHRGKQIGNLLLKNLIESSEKEACGPCKLVFFLKTKLVLLCTRKMVFTC
jgi:L-amino acid N-acyltransferase YncA